MADPLPPRPRWVKVVLGVAAVIIVAVVVLALAGGGDHGPGRHAGMTNIPAADGR